MRQYEVDIKEAWAEFSEYTFLHYDRLDNDSKLRARSQLLCLRDKLSRCFGKLNCKSTLSPNILATICEGEEIFSDSEEQYTRDEMAEQPITQLQFLQTAESTLRTNYSGNPLGLDAFINSVELLKAIAGDTHVGLLRRIVISKLEGKALESIPENSESLDDILTALKTSIKPDNSKVIAGRMMALRTDKTALNDFTKQAEELADALRRSLIVEGISQKKAQEMVIEKTVEMCRASAKTDLVRSILAATPFQEPKEVAAKFVVETAVETREKQVLHYRSYGSNRNRRRGNFSNNNSRRKGNYSNNSYRNNNRANNGNNSYRNGNRGNRRGYSGDRGRGGYYNNNRFVRYAENSEAPPQDERGMNSSAEQDNIQFNDRGYHHRSNVQFSI